MNSSEKEHTDLINLEENSQLLEEQFETALVELKQSSEELSARRHKISTDLDRQIVQQLQQLGMEKARFQTRFKNQDPEDEKEWSEKGIDQVEFMLSVNPGQNLKSLIHIASGENSLGRCWL